MDNSSTNNNTPLHITKRSKGSIVELTLNRPAQMNVLSLEMLSELQIALDKIANNKTIRVVILSANGKAFCTGHDLKDMRSNYTIDYQTKLFTKCSAVMLSILKLPQPVIAKVQGIATAAGCQLVATCDLAIAAASATFATSGINNGLFCTTPAVALSRNVSRKHALEMLFTGDFINSNRAEEIGLINKVVADNLLNEAINQLAIKLATKSAYGLSLGKSAFYKQLEMGVSDAYSYTGPLMAKNVMDADAAEGFDAFIEKREPEWDQMPRDKSMIEE